MSRIKIFLLLLIIAALSIVFIQNREPIALKLLCPDNASSCLYQTAQLPLAIWIGLFTLNGAIINLLVQFLSAYGYSNSNRQKYPLDDDLYPNEKNWNTKNSSNKYSKSAEIDDFSVKDRGRFSDVATYEVKQEPQNVEHSGSTYSYKYREASDRFNNERDNSQKTSAEPEINSNVTREQDDEDWI